LERNRIQQILDGAERAQRARLLSTFLVVLLAAMVSLTLAALVIGVLSATYDPWPRLGVLLTGTLLCLVSYILLHRGWMGGASWLFFLGCMALVTLTVFLVGFRGPEAILFMLLIVLGGLLAGGRTSLILAGLSIVLYASVTVSEKWGLYIPPLQLDAESNVLVTVSVRLVAFGLMGLAAWFFANNLQDAMRRARQQAMVAEEKNTELVALKEDLERRVRERTQELTQALETVAALSAPVIPVAEGIIILPLVGHADEERMHHVTASLLEGIKTHRAHTALLDVTGLALVDATVAAHLVEAAQGARLLGCELVLVGIRAEVARALARLDVDLAGVVTQANLQSGIEYALKRAKK
jgi:anti-anti-sigma regulatory factor